jgi:hypothetical protein
MASRKEKVPFVVRCSFFSFPASDLLLNSSLLFSSHHRHRAYLLTWLGAAVRMRDGRG